MTIKLKDCPFCDGTAKAFEDQLGWWTVECVTCNARTQPRLNEKDTAGDWNTRAGLAARSPRDEEVEKAVEAVERLARAYEAHPPTSEASVSIGQSLRTLLDHVSPSPRDEDAVEKVEELLAYLEAHTEYPSREYISALEAVRALINASTPHPVERGNDDV